MKYCSSRPSAVQGETGPPRRRRALSVTSAVALSTLTLATYGGISTAQNLPAASSGLTGSLTISEQAFTAPIIAPVISAFQKQNPNLHITASVQGTATTTYTTVLLTEKLAGDLQDIVNPADVEGPEFAYDGIGQDLSPYLAKDEPYAQSYWLPNILASYIPNQGSKKGDVFGLPNEADAIVIAYNINMFKKAGVPLPTDNWTWSQMLADAKKLAIKKDGVQTQWGLCFGPDSYINYNPFIHAYLGRAPFTATTATVDSAAALKAWQLMLQPLTNGEAVPFATENSTGCQAMWLGGQVGMFQSVRGSVPALRPGAQGKFNWDVVPMPYVQGAAGNTRPTGAGSVGWDLSTQAKNVPAALAFLKFLYSKTGAQIEEKAYGVVPPTPAGLSPGQLWEKLPGPPNNTQAYVIAAKAGSVAPEMPGTAFTTFQTDATKAVEAVLETHASYAQAFGTLQSQVNALYKTAKSA
jgi:multiple sugar transport system substrate-binding protein